ncbi:SecB-like chaperone [Rhodococcus sp. AD45]|nr:SecB-like chaperone [Rhodococcus sp. AD45]
MSQIAGIHGVFTNDIRAEAHHPPLDGPFILENNVNVMGQLSGDEMLVTARYVVTATTDDEDYPETAWTVDFKTIGVWELNSDAEGISHEALQSFALGYGVTTLHPYARETVQNLTGRLGYPGATIEILLSPMMGEEDIEIADPDTFEAS